MEMPMEVFDFMTLLNSGRLKNTPVAAAVGVFDLAHLGHRRIFETLNEYKSNHPGVKTMVITFNKNPKGSVSLDTLRLREKYLSSFQINSFAVIDFSDEFGKLSASEFIQMLLGLCDLKALAVGEDFHCGRKSASSSAFELDGICRENGKNVDVMIVKPVLDAEGVRISSTLIRECIQQGRVELVPRFTLRPYQVDLATIPSIPSSSVLRYSKKDVMQLLPPPGTYDGAMVFADEKTLSCSVRIDGEGMELELLNLSLLPDSKPDILNLYCRSQK
jgi:FAD synthase